MSNHGIAYSVPLNVPASTSVLKNWLVSTLNWVSGSTQPACANFAGYVTSDSNTSGVDEPEMKSCSSCDRYVVESVDSTWTVTLMFGLAFSKALIAACVCLPSVPSPDSANTMVCLALAATDELDPPPELQAAAPAVSATAPMPTVTARHLDVSM